MNIEHPDIVLVLVLGALVIESWRRGRWKRKYEAEVKAHADTVQCNENVLAFLKRQLEPFGIHIEVGTIDELTEIKKKKAKKDKDWPDIIK